MTIIEVNGLSHAYKIPNKEFMEKAKWWEKIFYRKYDDFYALKDVSFRVEEGEVLGYIGRNGAGKTTTIKILAGILEPTQGEVKVLGMNPYKERKKLSYYISLVFGNRENVFFDIPLIDSIKFFADLYGVKEWEEKAEELSKLLGLQDKMHIPVRKMSFGERKKSNILVGFLHDPKVVFLDEPTIGLDIFAKDDIRRFLRKMNRKLNSTIFLTSHYMEDIEEIAHRVIWLEEGRIKKDALYQEILDEVDYKIMEVEFLKGRSEWAKDLKVERVKGKRYVFVVKRRNLNKWLRYVSSDPNVKDVNIRSPSLEEIIKAGW